MLTLRLTVCSVIVYTGFPVTVPI